MVANLLKGRTLGGRERCAPRAAGEPLEALGARWANSPGEAAQGAEVILTSLPDHGGEAVAMGESGVLHGAEGADLRRPLHQLANLARRMYAAFPERGLHALDAPVSGGPYGAETATLIIMVGGDEEAFGSARPALESIGDNVTYIGETGAGRWLSWSTT